LDYAAATPIDTRVGAAMQKAEREVWANASSLHHEGELAKAKLEEARIDVAKILHCRKNEIIFTSGGTEGANLAILGIIKAAKTSHQIPHVITSTIEHPAVLEPIKYLLKEGMIEVSFVSPNEEGIINPQSIERETKSNTVLICIMHSNNEIGTIQPIRKIKSAIENSKLKIKNSSKVYLLVDASQSACYEDVSVERLGADVLILDGIKMYGPRGAGILVVRHAVRMAPIVFGGGQEGGVRSGTENVVGAVGLSEALKICEATREKESARLKKLRDYAIAKIITEIPPLRRGSARQAVASLNGSHEFRLPNNINICFPNTDSEFLVIKLDMLGFAVSAASACNTLSLENSSYVIESLGRPECASSSLRFTLGRDTKKSDLDKLIKALKMIV